MSWFKSWFNSPYYHILYSHRDESEAEKLLDGLIEWLQPPLGARILDLACGKGRHSVYLNEKGFEVSGVDLSPENIQHCLQYENSRLSFFVHDMRHLFRVNDFDFVFNLFTSFGYFDTDAEHQLAIRNASLALKPSGRIVIDFLNIHHVSKHLAEHSRIEREGIVFNIHKKIENGFLIKDIRFTDNQTAYHFTEKVAALQLKDFEKYLLHCGMKIITLFGDYNLKPFENERSPRLLIVAEKP